MDATTGELTFPENLLGLAYNEVEVTYTAGFVTVPSAVKVACAQIVKNAQATPAMNVKSSRMDTMQMQYFSGIADGCAGAGAAAAVCGGEAGLAMADSECNADRQRGGRRMRCCAARADETVLLRVPAPAVAGDVTEQLGLATPEFQDVELAPVVFRRARRAGGGGGCAV